MLDHENETSGHPERRPLSPWLVSYALTMILGGCYALWTTASARHQFVVLGYILGLTAILVGVLMWLRHRGAVVGYVAIAIGMLGFACFRFVADGYTQARLGMTCGSLMMLLGLSSVIEEVRGNHTH